MLRAAAGKRRGLGLALSWCSICGVVVLVLLLAAMVAVAAGWHRGQAVARVSVVVVVTSARAKWLRVASAGARCG